MKTTKTNLYPTGFTLLEIMIIVAIIGILSVIAVPAMVRARTQSCLQTCISNLSQIAAAKSQWALEARKGPGAKPKESDLFGPHAYIRSKPECPTGGSYDIQKVKESPTCTIPGHALD